MAKRHLESERVGMKAHGAQELSLVFKSRVKFTSLCGLYGLVH